MLCIQTGGRFASKPSLRAAHAGFSGERSGLQAAQQSPYAKPEGGIACKPPKLNELLRAMLSFTHPGDYIFFDFRVFPLVPRQCHGIERVPCFEEALPFPFVGTFWSRSADTELFQR